MRVERLDREPVDEAEHFNVCGECGQAYDMRDLDALAHHEEPGHGPTPTN